MAGCLSLPYSHSLSFFATLFLWVDGGKKSQTDCGEGVVVQTSTSDMLCQQNNDWWLAADCLLLRRVIAISCIGGDATMEGARYALLSCNLLFVNYEGGGGGGAGH